MNARKFFSRIGVSYFIMIILIIGIQIALSMIVSAVAPGALYRYPLLSWVVTFAPEYLVAMPVCVLLLRRLPAMDIHQNRLGGKSWFRMMCISLFLIEVGAVIGNLVCALITRVTPLDLTSSVSSMMETGSLWISFLFTVILTPIIEELVFRKALIDRAIVFGDRTAIILSGLIFGLSHGNFYQFFYAFALGCLFAYIYIRTGKIRHTISFHMIVNFLGGFVGTALLRQLENLPQGAPGSYGMWNFMILQLGAILGLGLLELLTLAFAVVGLILFILSFRKRTLFSGEYQMPVGETGKAEFGNVGMILFLASIVFLFAINMI